MAKRRRELADRAARTVRFSGRDWPVIDRQTVGRRTYLILEKTGASGRERYLAFDPHAGPGGDTRALLVFPRTASAWQHVRVLKRLSAGNPNLPTILEYQCSNDQILLVLTWVRGPDLRSYLDAVRSNAKPPPSAIEGVRLVRGLAHGLAQLHRRHTIIHGDLKPANLIVARNPSRLVMIDFGSAWFVEQTLHRQEGDGLSRQYAAPELQGGAPIQDFRSDQFSASVILYELLTLQRPYDQLGGQAGLPGIAPRMRDALVPPSRLSPDRGHLPATVWTELDRVVTAGLALDPDGRFPTCDAWLDALDHLYSAMRPRSAHTPDRSRVTRVITWFAEKLRY